MSLFRIPGFHSRFFILLIFLSFFCNISIAQLAADFSISSSGGCSPLAVSFTNKTAGASANATYNWDFGNANSSVEMNPGAIFINEKIYTISLTVKDGSSSSTLSKQVTVYSPPNFDFSTSAIKGCLPVPVNLSANISSGSGNNYTWDFGDGNVQQTTGANTSHIYIVPQKATVSLTVSNNYGCTKTVTKQNLVEILPAINASFAASKTILCRVADAVQFSNSSVGPGTLSYIWDFGDGTTSTQASPTHNFNLKGIFTVKLTVNSSEGCTATSIQNGYINVASFNSDFTVPGLLCSQNYYTFNNTSSPSPAYSEWYVDGVLNYYYQGYFSRNFTDSGSYKIELKNTFGSCRDSVTKIISIKQTPNPQGFISGTKGNCGAPILYNFKDTTAAATSWEWDFNYYYNNTINSALQAPSYTYATNGGYTVRLKVSTADGCSAYVNKYININGPYISIVPSGTVSACGPYSLTFSTTNSSSNETIIAFNWNFGDGATSTDPQPTHLFTNPGYYSVTLSYTTASGCTGTVSYNTIQVYSKPIANFTAATTTICGNTSVIFNAVQQGGNTSYQWDFGDGSYGGYGFNNSSIAHQYTYDSTYTVRLIVYNQGGCSDTMIRTNYIKVLPPFPVITKVENSCDGDRGLVKFWQASKKAIGYTWDFGDGSTTNLSVDSPYITHQYKATGKYKTVLITTNGQCTTRDSITTYVFLKQNPLLTANAVTLCENSALPFTITNLESNPHPYLYTYGDAYVFDKIEHNDLSRYRGWIYSNNPNYYWKTSFNGTFNTFEKGKTGIRIILKSTGFGCNDTTNFIPLNVKGSSAGFQIITADICFKLPVIFKDTSTTNSKIISWQWNFGDGTSQIFNKGGIVNHTYANPGNYNISLTITDTSGCSSTSNQYQYVNVNGPKAQFYPSPSNTFITLPIIFYNNTNNYNSPQTQYSWSFGDGNISTDYSPTHDYTLPGQYTITLIAFNPVTGCRDTTKQLITVNNFNPAFTLFSSYLTSKNCPPLLVRFANNSINYQSVKWDFGDGNTADNLNYPSHIYEKPGKYIITLFVYGPGGLKGTYYDSVTIIRPQASMSVDKNEGCVGHTPQFTATTTNANSLTWDLGDGSLVVNKSNKLAHPYNTPGIYQPSLMLTDSSGCNSFTSLPGTIIIRPNPVVTITPAAPRICRGQSINLVTTGGQSYQWQPSNTLNNSTISSPVAKPDSTTTYSLTVKDNIGCTGTSNITLTVVQKNKINATADTSICAGSAIQLKASGTDTYQWINTTAGLNNTSVYNPIAQPLISTAYTVRGTDKYNCFSDTALVNVKILSLPTVSISPINDILLGTAVQIISVNSPDVMQWLWSPADYLNCNNCPSPVSTALAPINYKLTVTNKDGCKASANIQLKMQCQENKVFIPTAFSPNDDGVNDVFSIKGISLVKHLVIYNRWGTLVYERSNFIASQASTGWDGKYKNEPMPSGTYAYFAEMECPAGGVFVRKGTVILVR